MKKIASLFILFAIVFCSVTSVYSADTLQPLWDNTHNIDASINFSGTTGTFTASIIGDSDVTDIYLMAWLYYEDSNGEWVEQTTWGAVSTGSTLHMDRTFTGVSGVKYKVDYTVYVYVGLDCEEISFSPTKTCP